MFKKPGNGSSRKKRWLLWILISVGVLLIAALLWLFYWALIAPVICMTFPHNGIYTDLSVYSQGEYREFEEAEVFDDLVKKCGFDNTSQAIAFYYIDNKRDDNPLYGKRSDVFSVDFQLDAAKYDEHKQKLALEKNDIKEERYVYYDFVGNYDLYLVEDVTSDAYIEVIAFNDETRVVRCILITCYDGTPEDKGRIALSMLNSRTTLSFEDISAAESP